MSYPFTHLLLAPKNTIVVAGPNLQVLDTTSGAVIHTTVDRVGPVRCAAIDVQGKHVITAGDDKMLKVRELDGLGLVNERELPKRPTAIQFTADGQTILVSDKFGDVFSYPFQFTPLTEKQKKDALSSHENPSGGQLILGHASLLNAFLLTPDEKYIITADRDEHIRVSWYPQGYNIEMFVSAIHSPTFAPSELVSGGGDPVLKIWHWMTGTVKHEISVWEAVEPYIRVRCPKRRRGEDEEDAPEAKRKGRGKKAKGKGKGKVQGGEETVEDLQEGGTVTELPGPAPMDTQGGEVEKKDKVLVIRKIDTLPSRYLVFSAVGATALFSASYPGESSTSGVRAFEFAQPVLDFVVTDEGLIWVSLDGNWSDKSKKSFVHVLELSSSGEFLEVMRELPLLATLNSKCLHPASEENIKELDLYGDLAAMPKNTEAENDQDGETPTPADAEKTTNKKVLGRLKNKQAVLEKAQAIASASVLGDSEGIKEPDAKKTKSEHGSEDVVMS